MTIDYYLISAALRAHRLRPERLYVFGRDEGVDIVLPDALVSRRHAELRWNPDAFWEIHDLGSRNGVFVNSARISGPMQLDDGFQLQIGGHVFRLHLLPPGVDPSTLGEVAPQLGAIETRGHAPRLQDVASGGGTFSGEVPGDGFIELLQFFKVGKKSGRLDFLGGPTLASIWVVDGNPIHATYDASVGMDALIKLGKHPPPRFTFHAAATSPVERSLEGTMHGIVMEVARRMDLPGT